jgi:hypothetical protein
MSQTETGVITAREFDPTKVEFSKLRKNKNGGKAVYINTTQIAKGKKFYLQLPFMRSPYGMSAFTDEVSGRTSYSLDLSFDADNEEATELRRKLEQFDDMIVEAVAKNSIEWLGKEFSTDVLRQALYKPVVRQGKDDYPATIKLKIMCNQDGSFGPSCFTMKREKFPLDQIEKGQRVVAICEVNQVWFIDQKFGVTIRLTQCLCERSERLPEFAFKGISLPEPDEDEMESTASSPDEGEVDE